MQTIRVKEKVKEIPKIIYRGKLFVAAVFIAGIAFYMGGRDKAGTEVASILADKELPIYCVDIEEKKVAISFDAAWGDEYTTELLDILKENNVKATFFMTGEWVEKYPESVKRMAAEGHELGNHSQNHKNMSKLSKEENLEEIMQVHNKVKEITGIEMNVFRPPYGDYDDELIKLLNGNEYYPIQWSVDSLDWKNYGVDSIVNTVLNHKALDDGAIILMHNGAKYTTGALQQVIDGLKNKGYSFVTIGELIYKENYEIDHTGKQIKK